MEEKLDRYRLGHRSVDTDSRLNVQSGHHKLLQPQKHIEMLAIFGAVSDAMGKRVPLKSWHNHQETHGLW